MGKIIEFVEVSKTYTNQYEALKNVTFSVKSGEILILSGPSGAGKSSIFHLLLRLMTPTSGDIWVNQCNVANVSKRELPHLRRYMGMVFQHPQLLPKNNVFDNVAIPLVVAGYRPEYIESRVSAALKKVGLLYKAHLDAMELSSGEQKLVEIARAIVNIPKILLVDEPTANVDAVTAIAILDLFKAFNEMGMTILIATHHQNLLRGKPVRTLVLRNGCLEE